MGFLDTLRHWGGTGPKPPTVESDGTARSVFLKDGTSSEETSDYDREQWRKKLKRLLSKLPQSETEWPDLRQEAGSLGFGEDWLKATSRQEFTLLVRMIVSDREVTIDEHHALDRARSLLGIPDREAETIFHDMVAEAEAFFGGKVHES